MMPSYLPPWPLFRLVESDGSISSRSSNRSMSLPNLVRSLFSEDQCTKNRSSPGCRQSHTRTGLPSPRPSDSNMPQAHGWPGGCGISGWRCQKAGRSPRIIRVAGWWPRCRQTPTTELLSDGCFGPVLLSVWSLRRDDGRRPSTRAWNNHSGPSGSDVIRPGPWPDGGRRCHLRPRFLDLSPPGPALRPFMNQRERI